MSRVLRASTIVGLAVMGSRVLGLARELVLAALFGAGKLLDAFLAGFQIPNMLRDLFAEGALSTAFTTTFAKLYETEGERSAWALLNRVASVLILMLGIVCAVGILLAWPIVRVMHFGFLHVPGKFELTVGLTRVFFPFILFVSLAAVVMGALNARFIFGLPASASAVFNLVSIALGVTFAYALDPQPDWRHPHFGPKGLYGMGMGVLLGGIGQLGVQLPALYRLGFRWRWMPDWRDPALQHVWRLAVPGLLAGAVVQVNVMVNGMFASEIDGGRSWLNCAFRLLQFPIGVFGVAIATVTLPVVARHHARTDRVAFSATIEEALRLACFLTIPAVAGLLALAPEAIGTIYQHGRFTPWDTAQTAAALRAYAFGLVGYATLKILVPCFHAMEAPAIPLRVSVLGMALNAAANFVLVKGCGLGHRGLALSTAILATVTSLHLLVVLRRRVHVGRLGDWLVFLARVVFSAVLAGAVAFLAARVAEEWIGPGWRRAVSGLVAGGCAGVGTYGLLVTLLRVPEATRLWTTWKHGRSAEGSRLLGDMR